MPFFDRTCFSPRLVKITKDAVRCYKTTNQNIECKLCNVLGVVAAAHLQHVACHRIVAQTQTDRTNNISSLIERASSTSKWTGNVHIRQIKQCLQVSLHTTIIIIFNCLPFAYTTHARTPARVLLHSPFFNEIVFIFFASNTATTARITRCPRSACRSVGRSGCRFGVV